jgi:hypothetical protein
MPELPGARLLVTVHFCGVMMQHEVQLPNELFVAEGFDPFAKRVYALLLQFVQILVSVRYQRTIQVPSIRGLLRFSSEPFVVQSPLGHLVQQVVPYPVLSLGHSLPFLAQTYVPQV